MPETEHASEGWCSRGWRWGPYEQERGGGWCVAAGLEALVENAANILVEFVLVVPEGKGADGVLAVEGVEGLRVGQPAESGSHGGYEFVLVCERLEVVVEDHFPNDVNGGFGGLQRLLAVGGTCVLRQRTSSSTRKTSSAAAC